MPALTPVSLLGHSASLVRQGCPDSLFTPLPESRMPSPLLVFPMTPTEFLSATVLAKPDTLLQQAAPSETTALVPAPALP